MSPPVVQRMATRPAPALTLPPPAPPPVVAVQRAADDSLAAGSGVDRRPSLRRCPRCPIRAALPAVPAGPADAGGRGGRRGVECRGGGRSGAAAGDLDALAGRLYDKIRYRLKAELRLDRERAGLITDRR